MKRYSVYSVQYGCVGSGLSYKEAVTLYNKECDAQKSEFVGDIFGLADPYEYSVSLVEEIASSHPEEDERPEDEPELNEDGKKITYYSWSDQDAPQEEE